MDRKILSFQVLTVAVRKIQVSTELPCPRQMTLFLPWLVPPAAVTMARVSLQAVTLWVLLKDTLMLLKTQEKCAKLSKSNDQGACYHSWRPSVGLLRKFYYVAPRCEVNAGVTPKEADTNSGCEEWGDGWCIPAVVEVITVDQWVTSAGAGCCERGMRALVHLWQRCIANGVLKNSV